MRSTGTIERIENLRGAPVYSTDREKIGTVENVFFDVETNEPRWLALSGGFLSTKSTVVPLHEATFEQDRIMVPFTKDQIRDAPDVVPDAISQHLEEKLFTYYGLGGRMWQDQHPVEAGATTPEYEQLRYRRWDWETPRR
jgi:sporulation protein YlmC with PRC-barrel domain